MTLASHFGLNPFHLSPVMWSVLLGVAIGFTLALVAIWWGERVDRKQSGDYLAPEDAGASPGASSKREPSELFDQDALNLYPKY